MCIIINAIFKYRDHTKIPEEKRKKMDVEVYGSVKKANVNMFIFEVLLAMHRFNGV